MNTSCRASFAAAAFAVASASIVGLPARGEPVSSLLDWTMNCGPAFEGPGSGSAAASNGLHCLSGEFGGAVMDGLALVAERQGRRVFGENFRVVHRLSWSPYGDGGGVAGNLDAVVPLNFAARRSETGAEERALFLQQGLTRWRDKDGFRRTDMRYGAAWRFTLSDGPDADVLGLSTVVQENVERGHRRLMTGLDYAGRWGGGWLQHFTPVTDWRPGRPGYEERPIGGTELGARLGLTTTISADAAVARWEDDGSGSATETRLGLVWRPHPWLSLRTAWGFGAVEEGGNARLALSIPLGGAHGAALPRWEGLGVLGAAAAPADMWRPIENVDRLRTVERVAPASGQVDGVSVRFLQSSAPTGAEIVVEVSLSAPASEDVRLSVRLAPGSGENPAAPGVDYVDEPVIVTIRGGAMSERVTFQLLRNPALHTVRTLTVDVSRAA